MGKILICGDSFAADWTVKYPGRGWPNMLAETQDVTNLAQAGCSEYKIYLQLTSVDFAHYDAIIVSHTSPYRCYVKHHPVHHNDKLHKNSDLIYTDLKEHSKTHPELEPIVQYFEEYFDTEHAIFVHNLICEKIETILEKYQGLVLHLTNLNWDGLHEFPNMLNFERLFKSHRGQLNHYNDEGNQKIYVAVTESLAL